MKVGITTYNMKASELVELSVAAEPLGFDSIWLGEHLVWPGDYASAHPNEKESGQPDRPQSVVAPDTELADPLVTLAAIAASTTRLELGTAIYLLALRHPLATARAVTTLQDLSRGRLFLGVGTGWLEEEFAALGVPFGERVPRFDEAVDLLRLSLQGGPFEHRGRWFPTNGVIQVERDPCHVPIIFGGNTERALNRAARVADGWVASGTPRLEDFLRMRDRLESLRASYGRTGPFRYWVRANSWDPELIHRYRMEAVDEVLLWARTPYDTTRDGEVWPRSSENDRSERLIEVALALGLKDEPDQEARAPASTAQKP